MRNCPAGAFQSTAVRNALLKLISLSAYEHLSNQDAVLSFPEDAIDSSRPFDQTKAHHI
jgi:hypothetical protein